MYTWDNPEITESNRNLNQFSALKKVKYVFKKKAGKFGITFSGLSSYSPFKLSEEMPLSLAMDLNLETGCAQPDCHTPDDHQLSQPVQPALCVPYHFNKGTEAHYF